MAKSKSPDPGPLALRVTMASYELTASVKALLDGRTERCDPDCQGYFISADNGLPERCDECATLNGYAEALTDSDLLALPEVWEAVREWEIE